ncbi:MAG TPA: MFS transporter [Candidatus Sulfotelmatobacter sp.]|nr:MFS transporter [Candidatus Sulfotelmatobacter sp.]
MTAASSAGRPRGGTLLRRLWPARQSPATGLDWLNLFVANIQAGFGPFISVYLTTQGWTLTAIGVALSLGTITAMVSQLPAGALVDAARRKSRVARLSVMVFTVSALLLAVAPTPLFVYLAEILHGVSSCTLGPAVVAMSLAVAGEAALGPRLGRNARYASIGNGVGAALMGACGYYVSPRSVFVLTAFLTLPALLALVPLAGVGDRTADGEGKTAPRTETFGAVLANRKLLLLALCVMLFSLANAALLPLAASALTRRAGAAASLLIAACIVLPQLIVALVSPSFGRLAATRGRRLVLLLGFAMLPLRGLLFALALDWPALVVAIQVLDGIAAASFGIMVPLVASDIAGRSGHFNLSLGYVGLAIGIGATLGTTLAGWTADRFGPPAAFGTLAAIGLAAFLLVWRAMPETRAPD